MTEIVLQRCPGGTLLSEAGMAEYIRRSGNAAASLDTIPRDDPNLIAMMKEDAPAYQGYCAHINIVSVPDGFKWKVCREARTNFEWVAPDA